MLKPLKPFVTAAFAVAAVILFVITGFRTKKATG